jgi:membrane associated rhomboid family serine protease
MIIPLKDKNPSGTVPFVTIAIIAANVLVFFYELSLRGRIEDFIVTYGLIPARFVFFFEYHGGFVDNALVPMLVSMFLHGGWLHIISNMWFLWIFGDNIEDRLGHGVFLIFYIFCGIVAGLWQVAVDPYSRMPTIGASGAVSGVLGAYLISYPFARIYSIFIIFPAEVPAAFFLIMWFVFQFLAGTSELGPAAGHGSNAVAYWEHIGGFISGIVLLQILPRKTR